MLTVVNTLSFAYHLRQMKFFKKITIQTYLLFFILILASFLRLYRLPEMAIFDYDQAWAADFAYRIIHQFPIQMIGQALSVEGLFMGPIGFYLLTPFYLLTGLHPLGGSIGAVFFSLLIIAAYFWVGKTLINPQAGLIAAFIRAVSLTEIGNDLNPAPLTISELWVLLLWLMFYKYWRGNTKVFPVITFLLALFTSMHPVHFPLFAVFVILIALRRKWPSLKTLALSIATFLIPLSPLILFEYFRKFAEVKRLIELFSTPSSEARDLTRLWRWLDFNLSEIGRLLHFQVSNWEIFGLISLGILLFLTLKKIGFWKEKFHSSMFLLTYAVFIIYYSLILPKNVTEYYFLTLTTLTIFYLGGTLSLLLQKKLFLPLLALLLLNAAIFNFQGLLERWKNPSLTNLSHKDAIVKEILKAQPKDERFFVSFIDLPGWNFGFDYLFKYYGHQPDREIKQPIYTIVIPKYLSPGAIKFSSGNIGLIFPD